MELENAKAAAAAQDAILRDELVAVRAAAAASSDSAAAEAELLGQVGRPCSEAAPPHTAARIVFERWDGSLQTSHKTIQR